MARRTGIYSGTFDPVHSGHIAFAKEAMRTCSLDEVVFIPEQKPRGKNHVASMSHRIALIERATAANTGLRVAQLASGQFNVEQTLPELRRIFSGCRLTLLMGSDVVRTFSYRWEKLDTLLAGVSLAIGMRFNDDPNEITAIMDQLAQDYDVFIDYALIFAPDADMTSSQIRNGTADKSRMLPGVLTYMQEHQLYT